MDVLNNLTKFASEDTTGIGALGLDWKAMLLQAGTFILLYFIFKKFVLEKVVKTLNDRRETIEESLETAHEIEKRSKESNKEAEEIVSKARKDSDEIIENAKNETNEMLKKAEVDATKKQDKMFIEAEARIEADVKGAKTELRNELLTLVATATETVLDEKINSKKDQELIKKALKDVKND